MSKSRPTKSKTGPEPRAHLLKDGSLESIADYISQGKAKNVIVMSGAGISTAAGIKDFRTPGTGLYDDLERFNLPYPEAVFDIEFFKDNPSPFYRLANELLPGRYRPTLTHYLLPLLEKKGLLLRSYSQNIDMLERLTGLDPDLLVEAHGSFATSNCIKCDTMIDSAIVKKHIIKSEIPRCKICDGLVKPAITFFGEELPPRFASLAMVDFKKCDLLIVLGTSLQVEPFNRLITRVPNNCPRLLINRERAGEDIPGGFDFDDKRKYPFHRDSLFLGNCDDGTRKLAKLCGWEDELQALFEAGNIKMQEAEELEALILAKEQEKEEEELEIKEKEEEKEEKKEEELEIKEKEDKANATSKGDSKDVKESTDVDELTERLEATGLSSKDDTQLDAKANSKERDAAVHKSDAKDASKAVPSAKEDEKNKTSADTK